MTQVRFDPVNGQVAIRTIHDFPGMQWCVATETAGSRHVSHDDVADWLDIPLPEAPL